METGGKKSGLTWPEWRLYANFLHRELARLWYGKKSVFTLVKGDHENEEFWELFNLIIAMTIREFGESHGLIHDEIVERAKSFVEDCEEFLSRGSAFASPLLETVSFIRRVLGDKLASEFLFDLQVTEMCILAGAAWAYAALGKELPYEKGVRLYPLEFYEGLPVAPELEAQFYGKNLA